MSRRPLEAAAAESDAKEAEAKERERAEANAQAPPQTSRAIRRSREKQRPRRPRRAASDALCLRNEPGSGRRRKASNTLGSPSCSTCNVPRPARPTSAASSGTIGNADCSAAGSGRWKFRSLRRGPLASGADTRSFQSRAQRGWRRLSITPVTRRHQQDLACWPSSMVSPVVSWSRRSIHFPTSSGSRRQSPADSDHE